MAADFPEDQGGEVSGRGDDICLWFADEWG